jgi:hypothetical protein
VKRITISVAEQTFTAALRDSPTAEKLWEALPVEGVGNVWGEEIYFGIPVSSHLEPGAKQEVDVGTIAFWPAGNAFCIFFGPTPVSTTEKPRAYSPVNILGKIEGDVFSLQDIPDGTRVKLTKADG